MFHVGFASEELTLVQAESKPGEDKSSVTP